ncbi:hypothetical protein JHK85_001606 [Glycine max]|nr:hypothetical protein JHK85_001606 [Glycine max]
MESELKDLNSKPPTYNGNANSICDDRPLLKSEPPAFANSIVEMEKKLTTYVHRDVYDTMGHSEFPGKEKLLLDFALGTLLPIRGLHSLLYFDWRGGIGRLRSYEWIEENHHCFVWVCPLKSHALHFRLLLDP